MSRDGVVLTLVVQVFDFVRKLGEVVMMAKYVMNGNDYGDGKRKRM